MYKIVIIEKRKSGAKVICKRWERMKELVDYSEALNYLDEIYDNLTNLLRNPELVRISNIEILYVSRETDGEFKTAYYDFEKGSIKRIYKIVKR